jgi:methionyl-tRNA formyltransferase
MRLLFVGSSGFSLRCLEKTIHLPEMEIVGIITNPETFSISYRPSGVRNVLWADLRPLAELHGIPVLTMGGMMNDPALLAQVQMWKPDLILVVGWYHMVPKAIRDIVPAAGMHASLLPDYSGGAPLVWAIINDEKKTGMTFFMLEDGVDSGPVIGQAEVPIHFEDTIATLYARAEEAGLLLLEEHLPKIASGKAIYTPQDDSKRRVMPQRSREDGKIDWRWPSRQIYNFVRAQTRPYPGAFTYWKRQEITIWKGSLSGVADENNYPDGAIVRSALGVSDVFGVRCGDGRLLWVHEVGLNDGTVMSGSEFVADYAIDAGTVLHTTLFR